jgi:hypothetical protein
MPSPTPDTQTILDGVSTNGTTVSGPPDRLTDDELAYLRRVTEGFKKAADLEAQATTAERQAAQARSQATALAGAYESWTTHLIERYQLNPETDRIDADTGRIERAAR